MPPRSIVRQLRSLGPPHTIDSALLELKNTCNSSQRFSRLTEFKALQFFIEQDYKLFYFRKKIFHTEVDLLLWSPEDHITIVEVKTLSHESLLPFRITLKQKNRLLQVRQKMENDYRLPVELLYAFVTESEVITISAQ